MVAWTDIWRTELSGVICEVCDSVFLLPPGIDAQTCPHCFRDQLDPLAEDHADHAYSQPPELVLDFQLGPEQASARIAAFIKDIPLPPPDLSEENLRKRMKRVYIPIWLVDAHVSAQWSADAGYHYQVVSHADSYSGGNWQSKQIQKQKTRQEPRLGTLDRAYNNIPAPALNWQKPLVALIGEHNHVGAFPYLPGAIGRALIQLPNRAPDDAWADAQRGLMKRAAEDCRMAAGADEIKTFRWEASFDKKNWTQMLLPLYSTSYIDDEGQPRTIYVNGSTGQVGGTRRASRKRANQMALIFGSLALLTFLCSIAVLVGGAVIMPPAALLGILIFGVAFGVAILGGFGPIMRVQKFNQSNPVRDVWAR